MKMDTGARQGKYGYFCPRFRKAWKASFPRFFAPLFRLFGALFDPTHHRRHGRRRRRRHTTGQPRQQATDDHQVDADRRGWGAARPRPCACKSSRFYSEVFLSQFRAFPIDRPCVPVHDPCARLTCPLSPPPPANIPSSLTCASPRVQPTSLHPAGIARE